MNEAELQRIVDYVRRFTAAQGCAPSYAEIAEGCGLGSVGHVQYRVNRLIREGRLARTPGRARSLKVITPAPAGSGMQGKEQRSNKRPWATVRRRVAALWRRVLTPK